MRKKVLLSSLILFLTACLAACQAIMSFVVANKSNAPLKVLYTLKKMEADGLTCGSPHMPEKKSFKDVNNFDIEWTKLLPEQYSYDEKSGQVIVELQPNEALRVDARTDYSPDDTSRTQCFPVAAIRLEGANGDIQLEGEQARLHFIDESGNGVFLLDY